MSAALPEKLPPALVKAAKKCRVRECDEVKPGSFEAYVDEGDQTADVTATFSGNKLTGSTCDCEAPQPCQHTAALLIHLNGDQKLRKAGTVAKTKTKKVPPAIALLETVDPEALKTWLRELFTKHKDVELSFLYAFEHRDKEYTPAEVTTMTQNAIKLTLGRTRNADATSIRKIVRLWAELHAPLRDKYLRGPADEGAFLLLQAALDVCMEFYQRSQAASAVQKYVQQFLESLLPGIVTLAVDETFRTAVERWSGNLWNAGELRLHYLYLLDEISSASSEERRRMVGEIIGHMHRKFPQSRWDRENINYQSVCLDILIRGHQFSSFHADFQPHYHANEYNNALAPAGSPASPESPRSGMPTSHIP